MRKYDKEGTDTFECDTEEGRLVICYSYGIQYDYDQDIGTGSYRFCGLIDVMPTSVLLNGSPKQGLKELDLEELRFEVRMNHL